MENDCTHGELHLNVPGFYYCPNCGAAFEAKQFEPVADDDE